MRWNVNKIKFAVLDIKEGLKIIEVEGVKYSTLCSYLHEDYLDHEHPTNIKGVWMIEDDAFEYAQKDQNINQDYVNNYSLPFFKDMSGTMGTCVLFRPGKTFGKEGNFDDIVSLTEKDIKTIEVKVNEVKHFEDLAQESVHEIEVSKGRVVS